MGYYYKAEGYRYSFSATQVPETLWIKERGPFKSLDEANSSKRKEFEELDVDSWSRQHCCQVSFSRIYKREEE